VPAPIVLLGPQRLRPTLVEAVGALGLDGPIATITAGWEEREAEIDELSEHLGLPVVNLRLHERTEKAFHRDRAFFDAYMERRRRLRQMHALYTRRLRHQVDALRELDALRGSADLLADQRAGALAAIRRLDDEHLERVAVEYAAFEERWNARECESLAGPQEEIAREIDGACAVAIAGGNVEALLHRLRLFELAQRLSERPLLAWSAGAMVLGERIVLYHDSPPQGPGYPEIMGPGLGLVTGVLPLPHAHRRLRLDDRDRVGLFARRFAPLACLAFEDGGHATLEDGRTWTRVSGVRRLCADGMLVEGVGA